jgi:hypothetical protein
MIPEMATFSEKILLEPRESWRLVPASQGGKASVRAPKHLDVVALLDGAKRAKSGN